MNTTMAINQYGIYYYDLGLHPRKELLQRLNKKRAEKMFIDVDGKQKHVGYIIGKEWLTILEVTIWEGDRL